MPKKIVLCFLIVLLVLLSSCENFMKGSSVKDELNRLVEEANSPDVELYFYSDSKEGVVAPNGIVSHRKGQTFPIVFIENSGYRFLRWEVLDRKTMEPVTDALVFENPGARETKATLVRTVENLYIHPVCVELPRVVSFYPAELDGGVYANTPVRITFNMPVTLPAQELSDHPLVKVLQTYPLVDGEYSDITNYFNQPQLSEDGRIISVSPKSRELSEYIQNQNVEKVIMVKVSLTPDITALVNGIKLNRYVPDTTDDAFYYRINYHVEEEAPEKIAFFATRDELLYEKMAGVEEAALSDYTKLEGGFLEGTALSNVQAQSVYSRMAGQYVYFYGEYRDTDSGFDTILVEEKFLNTKEGIPSPDKEWVKGNSSGLVKWDTASGSTRFILKYKINSNDGAVNLRITPCDFCGNKSQPLEYTLFKSTRIGLEKVEPFNWLGEEQSEENFYTLSLISEDNEIFEIPKKEDIPKTVRLAYECLSTTQSEIINYNKYLSGHELKELLFKNIYLPPDYYRVYYKIDDGDYIPFDFHDNSEDYDYIDVSSWIKTFDVDSIEGLTFKILVEDVLGNKEEREYQFPGLPEIACANSEMDPPLFYVSSDYYFDGLLLISPRNDNYPVEEQFDDNYFTGLYDIAVCKNKNLIGPLKYFNADELIPDSTITSNIQIESIQLGAAEDNAGTHNIIVTLNDEAWKIDENQSFDTLYIRYTTSDYNNPSQMATWYIKEFEKNQITCSFSVSTEQLYGNGLNVVVWGKQGILMSDEVANTDLNLFLQSTSVTDNAPPLFENFERTLEQLQLVLEFCAESTDYNYEEYIIHPEIKEFMSGLDYIEWWEEESPSIKFRAGHDFDWIEYVIPNWDLDSPKGKIHIKAADKKNNISECVFPYAFYDNIFTFEVMGRTEDDRRKFCMPNDVKNCSNYELIISSENNPSIVPFSLSYNINETESHYFSTRSNTAEYVINLSDELMSIKSEELEKDGLYLAIQDSLVKIAFTAEIPNSSIAYDSDNFGVSNAIYMYCGSVSDFSGKIVFLENGAMLSSNYPVIVYTLVTKQPYEECKDWDIKKWDRRRKQIGKEYFDFKNSVTTDIYESPLDQIEPGECYIMVAHFSDGSIKYSSVRQR